MARVFASSSRAKLKIRITSKEKTSIDESISRLRSSAARSFQTIAQTARHKEARSFLGAATGELSRGKDWSSITNSPPAG